jgi:hypothetical protein
MSSRKEQKEALRAERERRETEAAAAQQRKRMMGFGVAGALVLGVIVAIVAVVLASGGDSKGKAGQNSATPQGDKFVNAPIPKRGGGTTLEAAAKAAGCKLETHPSEGRSHVNGHVDYKTNPPSSGNHFQFPAEDGPYSETNPPTMESLVHSLEHGRVIFWYQPNASPQLKGQLKSLYDEDTYHVILAPNTRNMPYEVAASAWTRTLTCPKVNDKTWDALRLFRDRYRDQAPERVQ